MRSPDREHQPERRDLTNKPKIYLLDVETSPIVGYSWEAFDTNLLKILEFSKIISVAWKELGSKTTVVKCIADYPGYKKNVIDDEKLVKEVWKLLDEADVVIGHHSDAFDIKKLNARFVALGLDAPSYYQTVDTCKLAKKYFKFDSNSLNNLGQYLGLGEKIHNGGFPLWLKCMSGDEAAWELMKKYNAQDVILLEKLYLTLRPFHDKHPNLNLVSSTPSESACPSCLSKDIKPRGFSFTKTGKKQRYVCNECGSWSSGSFEKVKTLSQV